jgi:DNA gyrase subunit B
LSISFIATVKREGIIWQQEFSKGNPITDVVQIGTCDKDDTGTTIEYIPDTEIFYFISIKKCCQIRPDFSKFFTIVVHFA